MACILPASVSKTAVAHCFVSIEQASPLCA
jgi:hypothetical protein